MIIDPNSPIKNYHISGYEMNHLYDALIDGNASRMIGMIKRLIQIYGYAADENTNVTYSDDYGQHKSLTKDNFKAFLDENFGKSGDFLYKEIFSGSRLYR